jgi:NTP pyrophosphatase (non-canonical NTP hydrolase)
MNFEEYQKEVNKHAVYPIVGKKFVYPVLGLVGEAGEVAEKIKKILRDNDGNVSEEQKNEIKKELGDVLWYLSQLAIDLEISLDDVASCNIEKIKSRRERGVVKGIGDNR